MLQTITVSNLENKPFTPTQCLLADKWLVFTLAFSDSGRRDILGVSSIVIISDFNHKHLIEI